MSLCTKSLRNILAVFSLGMVLVITPLLGYAKDANLGQVTTNPPLEINTSPAKQELVYLNKSSLSQLATLKGVGQTKAKAIVTYREQFGDFKSVNELTKVSGIGDKIINENKSRLAL